MKIGCLIILATILGIIQNIYFKHEFSEGRYFIYSLLSVGFSFGAGLFLMFQYDLHFLEIWKRIIVLMILFTVALTDYKEMRIPNQVLLAGLAVRGIFYVLEWIFRRKIFLTLLQSDGIGFGIIFVFFFIAYLIIRNGVGMGDIKLMLVLSLYLGVQGVFGALFMSLICMFFAALFVLIRKKKKKGDVLPFAPAILLGTYISLLINGI